MFQISEPIAVYSVNVANGIRRNPAGIDTSERISGMQRPTSTATTARRSNQRSALATSSGVRRSHLP